MNCIKPLAYNLKLFRQNKGLTQDAMALECGISLRLYQKLESGLGNPTLGTLDLIARTFRKTTSDLLRLNVVRTPLSPEQFQNKIEMHFAEKKVAIRIRNLTGLVLWGNKESESILNDKLFNYPFNVMETLPEHSKVLLKSQLECESRGLVLPYLNSCSPYNGDEVFIRFYPTAILPKTGSTPYYCVVYLTSPKEDCEANYYNFCEKLLRCLD